MSDKPASAIRQLAKEQPFRANIQRMTAYQPGEQPRGGKCIKLNTNENPYPPTEKVKAAIQAAATDNLQRYPDPLGTAFCMRAADVLGVSEDWILCGNGSDDILTILARAFVDPGERIRLPYPSYVLYKTLAEIQDAQAEEVPFEKDFHLTEQFSASEDGLKLAFLPNPNSPSGTVIDQGTLRQLGQRLPCPLVIDEAYVDFANENAIALVKENPNVMVTRTLSKSYGLAGLRFGFLVAQPPIIQTLRKVKDSYNCDTISIAAATAAIDDQEWLQENRKRILATRARMTTELRAIGFTVTDSHANFVWCTWPDRSLEPIYAELKSMGILIRYMNYANWGEGIRISVGTDSEVDACLAALRQICART